MWHSTQSNASAVVPPSTCVECAPTAKGGADTISVTDAQLLDGVGALLTVTGDRPDVRVLTLGKGSRENLEANSFWEIREKDPVPRKLSPSGARSAEEASPGDAGARRGSEKSREDIAAFWAKQRAAVHAMKAPVQGSLDSEFRARRRALLSR